MHKSSQTKDKDRETVERIRKLALLGVHWQGRTLVAAAKKKSRASWHQIIIANLDFLFLDAKRRINYCAASVKLTAQA